MADSASTSSATTTATSVKPSVAATATAAAKSPTKAPVKVPPAVVSSTPITTTAASASTNTATAASASTTSTAAAKTPAKSPAKVLTAVASSAPVTTTTPAAVAKAPTTAKPSTAAAKPPVQTTAITSTMAAPTPTANVNLSDSGSVTGRMSAADVLETPWRKTINWTNVFEELPQLKDEIENYEPLGDLLTGEVSFPQVNILLFGGVGAGKSSVFNTWNSVFRKKIFNVARSGCSEHSLTTKFSRYPIMSGSTGRPAPLKLRVCDLRGLEPDHLMNKDNMRYVLEGNIPDKFQLDPSGNISTDMPGFKRHPELHERIHCVGIVQDASVVDMIQDHNAEVLRNIKEMQTVMNNLDVPQVVILTKVDKHSLETEGDVAKAYYSTKIKQCVSKVSEVLGIPRNSIFPMKNYESETDCDSSVDGLALIALKGILNQCDAFLFNHYDTINEKYKVEDTCK